MPSFVETTGRWDANVMLASQGTTMDGRSRTETWKGRHDGLFHFCLPGALDQGHKWKLTLTLFCIFGCKKSWEVLVWTLLNNNCDLDLSCLTWAIYLSIIGLIVCLLSSFFDWDLSYWKIWDVFQIVQITSSASMVVFLMLFAAVDARCVFSPQSCCSVDKFCKLKQFL